MKTFFQFSEQAKRHARRRLNENAQAQPDYTKFSAAWAEFVKDPNNAAVVQAMGKTALAQLPTEIQKLTQAAQAQAKQATPPATGAATAPATGATGATPAAGATPAVK